MRRTRAFPLASLLATGIFFTAGCQCGKGPGFETADPTPSFTGADTGADSFFPAGGGILGGGTYGVDGDGQIVEVDFGEVEVGGLRELPLTLSNTGTSLLQINDSDIDGDFQDWFLVDPRRTSLTGGASTTLTLGFRPLDLGEAVATLTFETNSQEFPVKTIVLRGRGYIPTVQVVPSSLDFGNVIVETSKTLSVEIVNSGDEPAAVRLRSITGPCAQSYDMLAPAGTSGDLYLLEPSNRVSIEVTLAPTLTGRCLAAFTVEPCDACQPVNVNLTGIGVESGLVVEPQSIDFGAVNPGATVMRPVTFKNIGNRQVQITSVDPVSLTTGVAPDDAFDVEAVQYPLVLEENTEIEVMVSFTPRDLKSHTGAIGWQSTDPKNPDGRVVVVGRGGGPDIEILPPTVEFGPVAIGAPLTRRVVIANVGFEDLVISGFEIRNSANFSIVVTPIDVVVPVGELREVVLQYSPTAEQPDAGLLVVSSNDVDEAEAMVDLQGTGVDLPPCTYQVSPPALNFGTTERNRKRSLQFGITNPAASGADCLVSVLEINPGSDPEFTLPGGNINGLILQPGDTERVTVEFLATRHGSYTGAIRFYISDPANPEIEVSLTASSRQADVLIAPDDLDFGVIKVGCSTRDREFCLYNTGTTDVTLMDLQLVEAGPGGEFFFKSLPPGVGSPGGQTVAPGDKACFTMAYRPVDLGSDSAGVYLTLAEFPDPFLITITGEGADQAIQTDSFVQLDQPMADILFVIDDSCSMGQEQTALATNFDSFIRFANQQAIDYHIGVTTTDVTSSSNTPGAFEPEDNSRPRIVTPDLSDPEGVFRANVQVGTSGSATERGLSAAHLALSDPLINDPTKNGGFLRPDAHLAIIFISDEEDQSNNVVDFYINFFLNIRGFRRANLFSASAIVGPVGGCSGGGGSAWEGARYIDVQQRTGGVFESICTSDWSRALENLSLVAFGYKNRFFMNNIPVAGTITVKIKRPDGTEYIASMWTYDAAANSIDFDPLAIPEPGDTVEITYEVQCL